MSEDDDYTSSSQSSSLPHSSVDDGGHHTTTNNRQLPMWHYDGTQPQLLQHLPQETIYSLPSLELIDRLSLGPYIRTDVSNLSENGRKFFNAGLCLMLSYQHEIAAKCFLSCLEIDPHAALAHALIALCHSPNYNFKGQAYYESTACHVEDMNQHDLLCIFPSQYVADRHSAAAVAKVEEVKRLLKKRTTTTTKKQKNYNNNNKKNKGRQQKSRSRSPQNDNNGNNTEIYTITDTESQLIASIRVLTGTPGVDPTLSEEIVGRPYANALRKVFAKHPNDPDIAYFLAESLMVLNAWQLYEYPSGKPLSPDVEYVRSILEKSLIQHPNHPGLCHMYVHLSEMSSHPQLALQACVPLRTQIPNAGHLIHMPTHIDVLLGNYQSCIEYNIKAVKADRFIMEWSPATAEKESFYFGYIVHNYHMAVYGAILGGMERKGMELANELNTMVNEETFQKFPNLVAYLESYSALEIHVMVRFGRWDDILKVSLPKDEKLMLYRTASIRYARALAYAMDNKIEQARIEADLFDHLRQHHPDVNERILHNNTVADLLEVDAVMLRGEIAYKSGKQLDGLILLQKAVVLQDNLNYDEPWGKMQPIRHALGGLLLEQGQIIKAIEVFRKDLQLHPKNPWSLIGLINCLKKKEFSNSSCCNDNHNNTTVEIAELEEQLEQQRKLEWSDFDIVVPCECCKHPPKQEK